MLEYALLTALIALAAVVAVRAAGVEVNSIFGEIQQELAQ
jgi:Flp pilus assembly pilin Flp